MNGEDYRRVKEIFNQAIELSAAERAQLLDQACRDNEVLRREVESLLFSLDGGENFMESSAVAQVAEDLLTENYELAKGEYLGHYKIIRQIGAGGMGKVYLAEDSKLHRRVALKVLQQSLLSDQQANERLLREARAAAALDHPNICQIYEISVHEDCNFIVMQYIEGETLADILAKGRLNAEKAIAIMMQISDALAEAHRQKIVHRDVKPQNIMVRRDGAVKVLDFGIAKVMENSLGKQKSQISTATGTVLGTATYMSPEQARGLAVDPRSDIWSLGVTLYEMLGGTPPFTGQTTSDLIVSILNRQPVPVSKLAPFIPAELDEIIRRCLSKNADLRYQTIEALKEGLRRVPRQSEPSFEEPFHAADAPPENLFFRRTRSAGVSLFSLKTTVFQALGASTNKNQSFGFRRLKRWTLISFVVLLTAFGGIFLTNKIHLGAFRNVNWAWMREASKPFELDRMTRLTTTGNVLFANVSPDGKYAAFVTQQADKQSLWIRQTTTASPKLLLPATEDFYNGLTFSLDSNFIYYVVYKKNSGIGVLNSISTLGGEPRKIIEDVDSPITFSPDGKDFAFIRESNNDGVKSRSILIVNLDGQTTRTLSVHRDPDLFATDGFAWSPDGQTIIAATNTVSDSSEKKMSLVEISVADGSERPFSARKWQEIGRVVWLGNNQEIVVTAVDANSGQPQVVQISYPTGEVQSVTKNLNGYSSVSATSDARSIIAVESDRITHLWTADANNLTDAKRITPGTGRYYQPSWTPDGKIVCVSEESGNQDIWIMDADGGNAKQLTFDSASHRMPLASPDGQYIIFASNRGGSFNVWRMNRDGRNLLSLTNEQEEIPTDFSPDGKLIYYTAYQSAARRYLWSMPSGGGGSATQIIDSQASNATLSPDGKHFVCWFIDEQKNWSWQGGIASASGGRIKGLNILFDNSAQIIRWSPDVRMITYTSAVDDLHNLWGKSVNGATVPKQLTNFDLSSQILFFSWSRDGKSIVFLRGNKPNDVVYLKAADN